MVGTYRGMCLCRTELRIIDVIGKGTGLRTRRNFLTHGAVKGKTGVGGVLIFLARGFSGSRQWVGA